MLILWHAHAVRTTDTTTLRMLFRCVARQRDMYGHFLTEGKQPHRVLSRNYGREACGDRIEILDRFREEPRPYGQSKEVPVSYEETPSPINPIDLLGKRLWQETPHPISERICKGRFRPAHTNMAAVTDFCC